MSKVISDEIFESIKNSLTEAAEYLTNNLAENRVRVIEYRNEKALECIQDVRRLMKLV